jgi:hypothetical protein
MNIERLQRMADLLERDAANPKGVKFDLSTWAAPGGKVSWEKKPREVKVDCGTSACALGLAAISGEFKKEGLAYEFTGDFTEGFTLLPVITDKLGSIKDGFRAGATLFEITDADSHYLFDPDQYDTIPMGEEGERFVAARIRRLIAGVVDWDYPPDEN